MMKHLEFSPFPLLGRATSQTLMGGIPSLVPAPPSMTVLVPLTDGDMLAAEVSTPDRWRAEESTVVLVHGLCGSDKSPYLVRLARRFYQRGVRVVRMNMRGCGSGARMAKTPYHAGSSGDVVAMLTALKHETPDSSFSLVGFSMGGNIALKVAGDLGDEASRLVDMAVAIAPPTDLTSAMHLVSKAKNRLYEGVFVKCLLQEVEDRHKAFPELGPYRLPSDIRMFGFDELYTAPMCGFANAIDYYQKASSLPTVGNIKIPTHVLFAEDDPLVDHTLLDNIAIPDCLHVWKTQQGGQLGFLGNPLLGRGMRWLDSLITQWVLCA